MEKQAQISDSLRVFELMGFSKLEIQIYRLLATFGPKKVREIQNALPLNRISLYKLLKQMANKGFIESTLDYPSKFVATDPYVLIELYIESRKNEAYALETHKMDLVDSLRINNLEGSNIAHDKFSVIMSLDVLMAKSTQISKATKRELLINYGDLSIISHDYVRTLDGWVRNCRKNGAIIRHLASFKPENVEIVKKIMTKYAKSGYSSSIFFGVINRNLDDLPDFFISDDQDLIFSIISTEEGKRISHKDAKGLWTNNDNMIKAIRELFENNWKNSVRL